ncbi:MAG: hypothetical protein ACE5HK_00740 [Candidatus Methylomirabilales bacterium]
MKGGAEVAGRLVGRILSRFGVAEFQGYPVIFSPIYPNVGAVPVGVLGTGVPSFLLCHSFVWRKHLKGKRWATSILLHELGHLKDFEAHPWQVLPLATCRLIAPYSRTARIAQGLVLLFLETKANLYAGRAGAHPGILGLSYLTYVYALRKALIRR